MAYFLNTQSILKKLLRYALIRVDLLESDSLDLDNLDIAFGRRNTIELKDLALKKDRLKVLLGTKGEGFKITDARILRLRIEVPADIYASSIRIDVDGVEVGLRVGEEKEIRLKGDRKGSGARDGLPTTQDIAASFLAEEPTDERRTLEQAALHASRHPDDDLAYGSESSDDELDAGTGTGLAVPTFLTSFLNGIKDRLQVTIQNVLFTLEFANLPDHPSSCAPASLRFSMKSLDVDGFTTRSNEDATSQRPRTDRRDKRGIHLRKIAASLATDPSIFLQSTKTSLAGSPAASRSTTTTQSPVATPRRWNESSFHSPQEDSASPLAASYTSRRSPEFPVDNLRSSIRSLRSQASRKQPRALHESYLSHHDDESRFGDADDYDDNLEDDAAAAYQSYVRQRHSNYLEQSDDPYDSPSESLLLGSSRRLDPGQGLESSIQSSIGASRSTLPTPSRLFGHNPVESESDLLGFSFNQHLSGDRNRSDGSTPILQPGRLTTSALATSPARSNTSSSSGSGDLSESRMFSHEDAESMYLSAMSEAPVQNSHPIASPPVVSLDVSCPLNLAHDDVSASQTSVNDDHEVETPRAQSPVLQRMEGPLPDDLAASKKLDDILELEVRNLIELDFASLWVPWAGDGAPASGDQSSKPEVSASIHRSSHAAMPGAFSVYVDQKARSSEPSKSPRLRFADSPKSQEHTTKEEQRSDEAKDVEAEFGQLTGSLDVGVGIFLHKLASQLMKAVSESNRPVSKPAANTSSTEEQPLNLRFSVQRLLLSLVERLPAILNLSESPTGSVHGPLTLSPTSIVQLNTKGVTGSVRMRDDTTEATIGMQSFKFGFPGSDIIAFDSKSCMRTSVRDLSKEHDKDITLTYRTNDLRGPEVHIDTLPIIVSLNLQQLDERLGCFGGLSGVLDLSQSIMGDNTPVKPAVSEARFSGKAVRFGPADERDEGADPTPLKVNARISGVLLYLYGKTCGLSLHTTALKAALRQDYAGVQIDKIKFAGPFLNNATSDAPLVCDVENANLRFQQAPNESDLDDFVSIITPSRDKYEDDDDIILDTLLRQRKKGSIIKVQLSNLNVKVHDIEGLSTFSLLAQELSKLASVTKYLPEDDRPGILSSVKVDAITLQAVPNEAIGLLTLALRRTRVAHVGLPALFALELGEIALQRQKDEDIVRALLNLQTGDQLPMVMVRQIGGELEPTIKVKLFNIGIDYRVPTIMAALGLEGDTSTEELATSMASSIATLHAVPGRTFTRQSSSASEASKLPPLQLDLLLRDCAIGLNPLNEQSKALLLFTNAKVTANLTEADKMDLEINIRKAALLATDNIHHLDHSVTPATRARSSEIVSPASADLGRQGYRPLASLSSADIHVHCHEGSSADVLTRVDIQNELFVLETCADSTQTLFSILGGLAPPSPPSTEVAYRTSVMPIEDMMKSFTGQIFDAPRSPVDPMENSVEAADQLMDDLPADFDLTGSVYLPDGMFDDDLGDDEQSIAESRHTSISQTGQVTSFADMRDRPAKQTGGFVTFANMEERVEGTNSTSPAVRGRDYLRRSDRKGALRVWDSRKSEYDIMPQSAISESPLSVNLRVGTFIWNLFDGYDWQKTRNAISRAVEHVQEKAEQRRRQRMTAPTHEEDEESEIGDFLFQSIWIAVPPNRDADEMRRQINRDIDDLASESGTVTSTAESRATSRPTHNRRRSRTLKLDRSKRHKMSIELRGVMIDVLVAPPLSGETQSAINLRVRDAEVFDHVPSSTWKKFLTYMKDAGPREADRPQLHAEILNVKPVPSLAASELVVKVKLLPLRLHVDQDALDFITRFFEFKEEKSDMGKRKEPSPPPFIQRLEIFDVGVKLDYKPKRVDYAGIRSGHVNEFKNFVTLDRAGFTLRRVILYGVNGPDRLHKMLNDIWMPDVQFNQLPSVLSGLAPVRPLVDVGAGVRDLVAVPMREYKKDGRLVRSVRKGAVAFAKTTTSELARLGAKVAIGTQNVLEGAEQMLAAPGHQHQPRSPSYAQDYTSLRSSPYRAAISPSQDDWDDTDFPAPSPLSPLTQHDDSTRAVSNYADQPLNVLTGVKSAFRSLEKDLLTTRDAVIAVGGEIRDADGPSGVASAVARHAPTIVLRPVIGGVRAVGTALLGAGNSLDRESRRKIEDKYKRT